MKTPKSSSKKFKFSKFLTVGAPDAESDYDLEKVFIENGEIEVLKNVLNPKCIIIGRTGAGKSALLKQFEESVEKVTRIEPESMSIKYLSNSNILDYFRSIDTNLNFFYKVLWKHVFIVELLKLYFDEDIRKKDKFFENLYNKVKNSFGKINPSKQKAINYLENWSDEFWLKTEHRVKTLEEELTNKFFAETGLSSSMFNAKTNIESGKNIKSITDIKHKAEKVISEIQADELYDIINIMKDELFDDVQKKFYIVIDDLDKEWVSPQIVYDLIASMIEVIKEFQVFRSVKIIIALRDNLHQLVFSAKEHRGGQREKFSALYLYLDWDRGSLRDLIDKRLKLVTNNSVDFKSAFEVQHKNKETGFDYVLDRTFLRPRDVISFINKIIYNANSKSHFTANIIKLSEPGYSLERFQALEDEWSENYGDIKKLSNFLTGMYNGFNPINIKDESFYQIYFDEGNINGLKGHALSICTQWRQDKLKFKEFFREVLFLLYRIGIIGIKKGPTFPVTFFYNKGETVAISDFTAESRIYVHKTFYSVLK